MLGKRTRLQHTTPTFFYQYPPLIKQIQPKLFIYHNLNPLINHHPPNTSPTIQQLFHHLNYHSKFQLFNSKK
ncbi:DNA cytosine methyltransferase, partial [Bacillus altitudinis]|uniref:DNA cytosine methyltransferase n=1 Tax=Bacillus altitudinis TaxID=293387 RepID=UPI003B5289CC